MKSKFMAAILGLGLTMAIPSAVFAQTEVDLAPDQDAQVAPAPSGQGSNDQGSNDQASMRLGHDRPRPRQPDRQCAGGN